ncbi:MAG: hypothetical protein E4H14_14300, partial [Candidatus Thorarchaeota archaeon]
VYAICLIDSSQNELSNNDCISGSMDGIAVLGLSEANDLLNNTCSSNLGFGVYVNGTGSNNIEDGVYSYNMYGIYLDLTFSNVISSCTCEFNDIGIMIMNDYEGAFNELIDNDCSHNLDQGIVLVESHENILDNNYCMDNGAGIYISQALSNDMMNNTCIVNALYGIYMVEGYYSWLSDNNCSDNPNGIWIEHSNSVTAQYNELTDCTTGITVIDSSSVTLSDNICTENDIGVSMTGAPYGQVLNSNCSGNAQYGVYLNAATNTRIENCMISDNSIAGVYIVNTDDGRLFLNSIVENWYGVFIESGTYNVLSENEIKDNTDTGVHIDSAPVDSYLFYNIFTGNFRNALDDGITSLIRYNYWSNYTGVDADSNGIGDTPHNITGAASNADPYPLVYLPGTPVFVLEPTDQIVEFGDDFIYDLDATSSSPLKEWRIDDTVHFSISNEGVITNIVSLDLEMYEPGEYPIQVTVENIYNFTTTRTFTVFCADTVFPIVIGPADYSYVEGTTGHTLRWNATDLTLESYYIDVYRQDGYRLRSYIGEFNSTSGFIEVSTDGLAAGTYNFTIIVQDRAYNHGFDYVIITVTEPGGPHYTIPLEAFLLGIGAITVSLIVVILFVVFKRRSP